MEYVFLADYARLDSGVLTVAGAYIDTVTLPDLPSMLPMAVVGAIALGADEDHAQVELTIEGPPGSFKIVSEREVPGPQKRTPELGQARAILVGRMMLPLTDYGVYAISVRCVGGAARTARFRVTPSAPIAAEL